MRMVVHIVALVQSVVLIQRRLRLNRLPQGIAVDPNYMMHMPLHDRLGHLVLINLRWITDLFGHLLHLHDSDFVGHWLGEYVSLDYRSELLDRGESRRLRLGNSCLSVGGDSVVVIDRRGSTLNSRILNEVIGRSHQRSLILIRAFWRNAHHARILRRLLGITAAVQDGAIFIWLLICKLLCSCLGFVRARETMLLLVTITFVVGWRLRANELVVTHARHLYS